MLCLRGAVVIDTIVLHEMWGFKPEKVFYGWVLGRTNFPM
ncbi:hypothetical protein BRCON_1634 [Candidatus Sumerlaea chitinivorans]|uniref:Uncharacterized protein n=1 Tax=Sumerlaea chitinivorans TaxID=2250252 RepID=A0A2Z4Y5B3_SUMC1|nr:hypothetical protein BRCON_1634 [Candidatus Sumerlaea chitinivorans]